MSRHLLIIGSESQLGYYTCEYLRSKGYMVYCTTRRSIGVDSENIFLDLYDSVDQWGIPYPLDAVLFFAAVTSVDDCRLHPEETWRVNVENTLKLIKRLTARGIFTIFPSTNLVFDGSLPGAISNTKFSPQVNYGIQKAEVEEGLSLLGGMIAVVRLTKIITPNFSLLKKWAQSIQQGEVIQPFNDMVLSPIPMPFVSEVFARILSNKASGVWQVSGPADVTYEELARLLADKLDASHKFIQPISSEGSGKVVEHLPKYTYLDTTRLKNELNMYPPSVSETLDYFIRFSGIA